MSQENQNPRVLPTLEELDIADAVMTARPTLVEQFGLSPEAIEAALKKGWDQGSPEGRPSLRALIDRIP